MGGWEGEWRGGNGLDWLDCNIDMMCFFTKAFIVII